MHTYTYNLKEAVTVLAFLLVAAAFVGGGLYFVQFGNGWTHWAGWAVTGIAGAYYLAVSACFVVDIIRNEYRIRTR